MGSPILGVHAGFPREGFSDLYGTSTGISLWRNFWGKLRFGAVELMGGYQKFSRTEGQGGALFVYPITANLVVRAPDALFRPYASLGGGAYGWDARTYIDPTARVLRVGWDLGWTSGSSGAPHILAADPSRRERWSAARHPHPATAPAARRPTLLGDHWHRRRRPPRPCPRCRSAPGL